MPQETNFEIKLPLFEGPFDLLLFFIERNEIDIYDIPIAQITEDFLDYMHQLEKMNIEVASEFILVAATLMKIKARLLIPKEADNPDEDPREELVNYLLEYRKYKSVLNYFESQEEEQFKKEKRANVLQELKMISTSQEADYELHNLDLYRLLRVFEQVTENYERVKNAPVHTIVPYPYTVEEQRNYLRERLKLKGRISFKEALIHSQDKISIIFNFLAILDLVQNRELTLYLGEGYNDFWVESSLDSQAS